MTGVDSFISDTTLQPVALRTIGLLQVCKSMLPQGMFLQKWPGILYGAWLDSSTVANFELQTAGDDTVATAGIGSSAHPPIHVFFFLN